MEKRQSLQMLSDEVSTCTKCPELAKTRCKTVFGTGNPNARLLLLGESPGAVENQTGLPFVGPAGQLLSNIIKACGWNREDIYICNVICCQPPGNRRPTKQEAKNCRGYLDAQIDLVKPEWIVCLGTTAASTLLEVEPVMAPLRGRVFEYKNVKVIATYHPSYLLRNPVAKKDVWHDLQIVIKGLKK